MPLPLEWIKRDWKFQTSQRLGTTLETLGDPGHLLGNGVVDDERIIGGFHVKPADVPDGARVHVFSNTEGATYWVGAQMPAHRHDDPTRLDLVTTTLDQYQYFFKSSDDATLTFTISEAVVEVIDRGPDRVARPPQGEECTLTMSGLLCSFVVQGWLDMKVRGHDYDGDTDFFAASGTFIVNGWQQHWLHTPSTALAPTALWDATNFDVDEDVGGQGDGDHFKARLNGPITVHVPLGEVPTGHMFVLHSHAHARALDKRQRNTYASAYLRDPQAASGLNITYSGLTPVNDPGRPLPVYLPRPAPACAGPLDPEAGLLQFDAPQFEVLEGEVQRAFVYVTRSGGTRGAVSAHFATRDDTAVAGAHYLPVSIPVVFADGQGGRRRVDIPMLDDGNFEGDRAIELALSDINGCAAPGPLTEAALIIHDDDEPPPPAYTVYVNVSGLAGQGLVIEDVITGSNIAPSANGTMALGYAFNTGMPYAVRVLTQPHAPDQVCRVENGSGTVADADVRNVDVSCVTPPPAGSLDPAFGAGGKVFVPDLEGGNAVVVQSTGRIVVLTERLLAGFHPDGSVDTSFGTDGRAPVSFTGGSGEQTYGLALQPDDKLLVMGRARNGSRFDMAVMRFDAGGLPDAGFGNGGLTTIDPYAALPPADGTALNHYAHRAVVGADGSIHVAGLASWRNSAGENKTNFAVARLNADGALDPAFGGGLGVAARVTNGADVAYALGVQSDGMVVLAGAANNGGGLGLARFKPNGLLDSDDPRTPENYGRDGAGVVYLSTAPGGVQGRANDLVMLEDNSIVLSTALVVPHATLGNVAQIQLVRVTSDGEVMGSADYVWTALGPDNDIGTQLIRTPDGKFLLSAQVSSAATVADFGVVRYNADLALDTGFGVNGVVLADFYGARDGAQALALAPDGGIVVVGSARNGSSAGFGMMRIAP